MTVEPESPGNKVNKRRKNCTLLVAVGRNSAMPRLKILTALSRMLAWGDSISDCSMSDVFQMTSLEDCSGDDDDDDMLAGTPNVTSAYSTLDK